MHKALGVTSLLAAVLVIAPNRSQAANVNDANDLLYAVRQDAAQIASDTDHVFSIPDRDLQVVRLLEVKASIQNMRARLERLSGMLSSLDPNQQHEYYRAIEFGSKLAVDTTAGINYLNQYPKVLWTPTYREITERIYNDASELTRDLRAFAALDKTQKREHKLETDLGTPAE
jgi:hypothetical protein